MTAGGEALPALERFAAPDFDAPDFDAPDFDALGFDALGFDALGFDVPVLEAPDFEALDAPGVLRCGADALLPGFRGGDDGRSVGAGIDLFRGFLSAVPGIT